MNTAIVEYGRVLCARWRWIVWGVVLALAATTCYLLVQPPMYRSEATAFIRTPGDISRVRDGGDSFAQRRAKTYVVLAGSPSVSARVIADLGLDIRPETLARRITATNPPGTALLDIAVSAPSAAEAQRTATVLLSEFAATVRALESVPGSLVPRAELVVVDPPRPPVRVVAWGAPVWIVLSGAAIIGLVLGTMAAVLRSIFDGSVRDPRDTSRLSGRPLLGSIGGGPGGHRAIDDDHIRHRLLRIMGDPTGGVIVVTEPEQSLATATAATFLTSVLAERDPSVVLVDLDLSSAETTHRTSDRERPGVADVLAGRCTLAEAILNCAHGQFLGAGDATDSAAALIDSTELRTMVAELRRHYTWVVLACPAATDAAAIADVSDMIVMVVRKGVTADEQLRAGVDVATRGRNMRGALRPRRAPRSPRRIRVRCSNDEGTTLKLKTFLALVRRYRRTFVVVAGAVFALGLAWILLAPAKFVSTTQLMVSIAGSTTAAAYQNDDVVAGRINSYITLLTSDVVNQRVIDRLGLSITAPELADKVSATNVPPRTSVIDVAVTDRSPAQAQLLAKTLATEFINYAEALETPTGEDRQQVRTTVVTAASEPREQIFERVLLGVLAAVAALVLGAVAVWIRSRTDPVVRTAEQAAAAAAAPVIGCVTSAAGDDLEGYRRLRTRLSMTDRTGEADERGRVWVCTSGRRRSRHDGCRNEPWTCRGVGRQPVDRAACGRPGSRGASNETKPKHAREPDEETERNDGNERRFGGAGDLPGADGLPPRCPWARGRATRIWRPQRPRQDSSISYVMNTHT